MTDDKAKSSTQADSRLLRTQQGLDIAGGHQSQVVSDEARPETPRSQVMEALEESMLQYDDLYKKLAQ